MQSANALGNHSTVQPIGLILVKHYGNKLAFFCCPNGQQALQTAT